MTRLMLRDKEAVVYLNKQFYAMEQITDALTKAGKHFTTQFTMQFSSNPKSYYIIKLLGKKSNPKIEVDKVYAFCNQLLV